MFVSLEIKIIYDMTCINNYCIFFLQVMGQQQYIVQPWSMAPNAKQTDDENNSTTAEGSGVVSETALAHAPSLNEQVLKEQGIPLQKAIQQVN